MKCYEVFKNIIESIEKDRRVTSVKQDVIGTVL